MTTPCAARYLTSKMRANEVSAVIWQQGSCTVARAVWKQPCELLFELDLLGKVDDYTLKIKFAGNSAEGTPAEFTIQ